MGASLTIIAISALFSNQFPRSNGFWFEVFRIITIQRPFFIIEVFYPILILHYALYAIFYPLGIDSSALYRYANICTSSVLQKSRLCVRTTHQFPIFPFHHSEFQLEKGMRVPQRNGRRRQLKKFERSDLI